MLTLVVLKFPQMLQEQLVQLLLILKSILSFKLGRLLGRPFVNWIVKDNEAVNKYLTDNINKFVGGGK